MTLMDLEAFHRPQLMAWLKIQMWDPPWLHVNSHYFTCRHILVEVFLLFFLDLRCGEKRIYVKLTGFLGFVCWGCVGKHLREVCWCLAAILLYSHSYHCDQCPFPFWNGHTTGHTIDMVLKRALVDKAFYNFFLPCVYMHSCSFICSMKAFCASANCSYPSPSFPDKLSSAWACGK